MTITRPTIDRSGGGSGMEVWRVTAEIPAATSSDHLWRAAERRATALAAGAGAHAASPRA